MKTSKFLAIAVIVITMLASCGSAEKERHDLDFGHPDETIHDQEVDLSKELQWFWNNHARVLEHFC